MAIPLIPMACADCAKDFSVGKYRARDTIARLGVWVCKGCSTARRNKESARPIGSVRIHMQSGYIEEKTTSGWRRKHIIVMERHLGRALSKNEVVHHKNEVKTDNSLGNLQLMTHGEHTREHNIGKTFSDERRKKMRSAIAKAKGYKTSEAMFDRIRSAALEGGLTQADLALKFGISQTAIYRAIHRKAWQ